MKPLSLKSSCDVELQEIFVEEPKSRQISIFVMMTLLMYVLTMFDDILPLPSGIVMLYIFKDFDRMSAKALLMSDMLHFLECLGMMTIPIFLILLAGVVMDVIAINSFFRYDCKVNNRVMLDIGITLGILMILIAFPMVLMSPEYLAIWAPLPLLYQVLNIIVVIFVTMFGYGVMFVLGFRGMQAMFGNLFKIKEIRMI